VVAQAKAIPGSLNGILRLHFCVWTDAETAWMTRDTLEPRLADFDPAEHHGKDVYLGLDLSQIRDITALGAVVETGSVDVEVQVEGETRIVRKPTYDAWIDAWTPGDTVIARELRDKLPYQVWIRDGHLYAPPGQTISYRHVAQTLAEYGRDFNVKLVAYDRYAFRKFEEDVQEIGLTLTFAEHPQGGLKKGKPLIEGGEGLWMPGSVRLFEEALLEGRIRLRGNPVLISAIMSAVTESDKWGNHWISKLRSVNKVDSAVALCMALGAAHAKPAKKREYQMFVV
jgi:phage terminase large subunit-like protein